MIFSASMFSKEPLNLAELIMVSISFALFLWSFRLFRNPEKLTSDSFLYRWIYNRFVGLTRYGEENEPRLAAKQIRIYTLFVVIISIFGIIFWGYKLLTL